MIKFISVNDVPKNRTVTYAHFVCDYQPQKSESERTRLTVGGNLIDYPGDVATSGADITTAKLVWNSVISTDNAQFMGMDIKNFYLNTPMDHPEYMRIHLRHIPDEIIEEYGLLELAHEGFVYVEINKGMYGLPQASILANKLLAKHLARDGYFQCRHTPGLWSHTFRPICFALVVDDLGVKYVGCKHAEHLLQALRSNYEAVSCDLNGELFCGITLKWDYDNRTVDLSMPKYIEATLLRFQHSAPAKLQYAPHPCNKPQYGAKVQMTEEPDNTPHLDKETVKRIQQIVGTLLYFAQAVDSTLLVPLSVITSEQSKATEHTWKKSINSLTTVPPTRTLFCDILQVTCNSVCTVMQVILTSRRRAAA
jgi:hypothetical protein